MTSPSPTFDYRSVPPPRTRRAAALWAWARQHKRRVAVIVAVIMLLLIYVPAATLGSGGIGEFSPVTLQARDQDEWLIFGTRIPVYRSGHTYETWPLVDYLIKNGYWQKTAAPDPVWISTYHANAQWRDGVSRYYLELSSRHAAVDWIRWTEANPEYAKQFWPDVLEALRDRGDLGIINADRLLRARHYDTTEEFEKYWPLFKRTSNPSQPQ